MKTTIRIIKSKKFQNILKYDLKYVKFIFKKKKNLGEFQTNPKCLSSQY